MSSPSVTTHDRPAQVLTVCLGNICRSPTAEAALVEAAGAAGVAMEVASAGTGDWHLGSPPDARMQQAAATLGLELRGRADRVSAELLGWADLVLVMDRQNLADVLMATRRAGLDTPVTLFRTFDPAVHAADGRVLDDAPTRIEGPDRRYAPDEVPDPYSGGPDDFTEVVEICRRTAAALVARWPEPLEAAARAGTTAGRPDEGGPS
jgi:protein-tyrosine phosphatase